MACQDATWARRDQKVPLVYQRLLARGTQRASPIMSDPNGKEAGIEFLAENKSKEGVITLPSGKV